MPLMLLLIMGKAITKGHIMAALKSNSSSAALAIMAGIAGRLFNPVSYFKHYNGTPIAAHKAARLAMAHGNWGQVAIIALAQAAKRDA